MKKPNLLFKEPTEGLYRSDPFSGIKGFMVGGMAVPTIHELSEQYFDAANLLMESIEKNRVEDYLLANPILFLYRHSLELCIKSLLNKPADGHSLKDLMNSFRHQSQALRRQFPEWLSRAVRELDEVDPSSTAFRYGENPIPGANGRQKVEGEVHVEFLRLRDAMADIRVELRNIAQECAMAKSNSSPFGAIK